jgi:hypothetical protein
MKDTTDKTPIMDEIKEAWDDLDFGAKFSICWILMLVVGLIILGIIFPVVGFVLLGVVGILITIGAIGYLLDY